MNPIFLSNLECEKINANPKDADNGRQLNACQAQNKDE